MDKVKFLNDRQLPFAKVLGLRYIAAGAPWCGPRASRPPRASWSRSSPRRRWCFKFLASVHQRRDEGAQHLVGIGDGRVVGLTPLGNDLDEIVAKARQQEFSIDAAIARRGTVDGAAEDDGAIAAGRGHGGFLEAAEARAA